MKKIISYLFNNVIIWSLLLYSSPISPNVYNYGGPAQASMMGSSGFYSGGGMYGAGFGAGMGMGMASGGSGGGGLPFMGGSYGAAGFGQTGFMGGMGYGMGSAAVGLQVASDITKLTNDMKVKQEILAAAAQKAPPPFKKQSKFFPECKTAPAKYESESLLKCDRNYVRDEITQMRALKTMEVAKARADFFESASLAVEGEDPDFGIQCIENSQKKLMDQLSKFKDKLTAQIRRLTDITQQMSTKMKDELMKIDTLSKQLRGGTDTADRGDLLKSFENDVCRTIIDPGGYAPTTGLRKIRNDIRKNSSRANQLLTSINSGEINRLIDQDLKQLKEKSGSDIEITTLNFPGISDRQLQSRDESKMKFDYERIKKRLNEELNITLKENDFKEFERSREVDINNSQKKYLYKQEIKRDCFQKVSTSITNKLVHVGDNSVILDSSRSSTLKIFRNRVQEVLERPNLTIDEQMAAIKSLESRYGGKNFRARYGNLYGKDAQEQFWTVSDVLESQNKYCDVWYEKEPISPGSPYSRKDLLESNLDELGKVRRKLGKTDNRIDAYVRDQLLSCKGIPDPVTRPASCTQILDTQSSNFCVPFAKKCISNLNKCLNQAQGIIRKKENKMKQVGRKYNSMVKDMINLHNAELNKALKETKSFGDKITKHLPGTALILPGNLSVSLPGYGNQKYGINLRNDADLNFLTDQKSAFTKMNELLKSVKKQEDKVNREVGQRVSKLKAQYSKEQQKWNQMATKCNSAQQAFIQKKQQEMQMQYQQQQQQQQALSSYCSSKQMARVYPGCEGQAQGLTEQMGQVMLKMPTLGYGSMAMTNQYSQVCNQLATAQMRPPAEQNPLMAQLLNVDQGRDYVGLCDAAGGTGAGITKAFKQNLERNSWQFAAVLNAKYPGQFGNIQANNVLSILSPNNVKTQQDSYNKNIQNVTSISNVPVSDLEKTSVGQYLVALANIETNSKGDNDICRIVQKLKTQVLPECKAKAQSTGNQGQIISGGADAILASQNQETECVKQMVRLKLPEDYPHVPIVLSHINTLSDSQKNVVYDMSEAMSQKMGQTPDMACAAQFLMPRMSPMGGGMPGAQGGFGPMTQSVRSY